MTQLMPMITRLLTLNNHNKDHIQIYIDKMIRDININVDSDLH